MLGAIAGDIAGSIYEWHNVKSKDIPLFTEKCFFTDDSVLTVALADTILSSTLCAENLKNFYQFYLVAGYGGSFHKWAQSANSAPYNSWGNSAAMRISPAGWAFDDLDTVLKKKEEFTAVTHNHHEGIKGGQATAAAIFLARTGRTKEEISRYIETQFGYDLSRHVDEIRPSYTYDVSSQAIRAFLDATDFEDALRNAISLGGDSDTLACITGGISESFYGGVPAWIEEKVYSILDARLGAITKQFAAKYCRE
ncbi:MAG: ADP-ribosylglycohydrolase family protein [Candidatus Electronema sp. VV]